MYRKLMTLGLALALSAAAFAAPNPEDGQGGGRAGRGGAAGARQGRGGGGGGQRGSMPALLKGEEWKAKLTERMGTLTPEQKTAVDKVKADLTAIKTVAAADLATDLKALATGERKPADEAVTKLATDLQKTLADKTVAEADVAQLAQDFEMILSGAAQMAESMSASEDINTILTTATVSAEDVQTIRGDLRALRGGGGRGGRGGRGGAASGPASASAAPVAAE